MKDSLKVSEKTQEILRGCNVATGRTWSEMVGLNWEGHLIGKLLKLVGNEEERDEKKEMEFFLQNTVVVLDSWLSNVALQ